MVGILTPSSVFWHYSVSSQMSYVMFDEKSFLPLSGIEPYDFGPLDHDVRSEISLISYTLWVFFCTDLKSSIIATLFLRQSDNLLFVCSEVL